MSAWLVDAAGTSHVPASGNLRSRAIKALGYLLRFRKDLGRAT